MKKCFSLLLILVVFLTGCSVNTKPADAKIRIVATVFPEYDWVKEIAGGRADITLLTANGVDMHSFQPTAEDIIKISTCDLFIYIGGESDQWVEDVLFEAVNKDMKTLALLEVIGNAAKTEEAVEGMKTDGDDEELDEHVWLSLKNAKTICASIAETLCDVDPENKSYYLENADNYIKKLSALDESYRNATENAKNKTLVFGDRFPFRYLFDDYGLSYYAAFKGCSAETEASFETIIFLAGKIDELNLDSVIKIETSDGSIAKTVSNNTKNKNQKIITLNSMQSVSLKDAQDGVTYLSVMQENLEGLKIAME